MTEVILEVGDVKLKGFLDLPKDPIGLVLFAHGSGSSRLSPRNQYVAKVLQKAGIGTLLFDLLTEEEEIIDDQTAELRFDIPFLAERLILATKWAQAQKEITHLPLGYFGASTGSAAALIAASKLPSDVKVVVSRGGRPDLAEGALPKVKASTLLIVGENDLVVIDLNEKALQSLKCEKKITIIKGATHLFEEEGTLEQVADQASKWFKDYLIC